MAALLDDTEMVLLYTPKSGDQHGRRFAQLFGRQACVRLVDGHAVPGFNFRDADEMRAAAAHIAALLAVRDRPVPLRRLVVVCAGGDGSLGTVLEQLHGLGIDIFDARVHFSGLALGTGNDSAQSQGWESHLPRRKANASGLVGELERRLYAPSCRHDIWRVSAAEGGPDTLAARGLARMQVRHGLRPAAAFSRLMCHYLSIGLQGSVGMQFERYRRKTRWANFAELAHQSLRFALRRRILRLHDFVDHIDAADATGATHRHRLRPEAGKYVELIVSNILGIWGRRVPLWQLARFAPSILAPASGGADARAWRRHVRFDDHMLEAYAIESRVKYLLKQLPWFRRDLRRLGQFRALRIALRPACITVMVDGDFFLLDGAGALSVEHHGQINMVTGPGFLDPPRTYTR